jgi:formate dehydrogenase major subunit
MNTLVCHMSPQDLHEMGMAPGDPVTLETRRNTIVAYVRVDAKVAKGKVFMALFYDEAAVNLLTNPTLDPKAEIPRLKYCGVRVTKGGAPSSKTWFDTQPLQD